MRLFVYEYASALGPTVPHSIQVEGRAMLAAVVEDFARIPGVHVATLLHEGQGESLGHSCLRADPSREEAMFRAEARRADFTLVIAPETAGVLASRSHWVQGECGKLLGSSPEAIEQTGDKLALSERLLREGVPTPRSIRPAAFDNLPFPLAFPVVCKPRDGAGSQATFLIRSQAELEQSLAQASAELPGADFIMQPFIVGVPASVAFIASAAGPLVSLPPCRQHLSEDGRFHYLGGELPLSRDLAKRASNVADRAIRAVPGLRGYVGVDLVLGESADGSGDHVIEINPRLTTSYIGLRQLARFNLAEALLATVTGSRLPVMEWKTRKVCFTSLADSLFRR